MQSPETVIKNQSLQSKIATLEVWLGFLALVAALTHTILTTFGYGLDPKGAIAI